VFQKKISCFKYPHYLPKSEKKTKMSRHLIVCLLIVAGFFACQTSTFVPSGQAVEQVQVQRIEMMPNLPEPYYLKDWKQTALDFDQYAFDFSAAGPHLPLIWLDSTGHNFDQTTFGLYTAIGDVREPRSAWRPGRSAWRHPHRH
jgi:hypothetical protein